MRWLRKVNVFWAALAVGYMGLAIASFMASAAYNAAAQDAPRGLSGGQNVGLRITVPSGAEEDGAPTKAEEDRAPTSGAFENLAKYHWRTGWITMLGFILAAVAAFWECRPR